MTKPTTLREEWKQEFRKKFVIDFGDDIKPNLIIHDDIMEIADWWLSKFTSHNTELLRKIEGIKCEPATGHPAKFNYEPEWYLGYNQALDEVINLINQEKQIT